MESKRSRTHNGIVDLIEHSRSAEQSAASAVLEAVIAEFHELRSSHGEVTRRIRVLRDAVNALRKLENQQEQQPLLGDAPANEAPLDRNVGCPISAPFSQKWESLMLRSPRTIRNKENSPAGSSPNLRRACRIALMETLTPVFDEEIYTRIARRGSFRFLTARSALHDIAHELNAMAENGEVRIVPHPSKRLWQRIPPDDQPERI